MRKSVMALLGAGLLLASASASSASVTISYVQPENFEDLPWSELDKEYVLKDLQRHFAKLGAKLPADRNLKLEIVDVDLAGRMEHRIRFPGEIRVMRGGTDWPRIDLRYTLESNGKVIDQGTDHIEDMVYLTSVTKYSSSDPLRYEKKMIDRWFAQKFLKR
ncbi:MAG TPA: DUF3016 domain-containing protein [Paucimonas sp.]|nr:DUF3016 domain-containing protein [Paucimonas sp.]